MSKIIQADFSGNAVHQKKEIKINPEFQKLIPPLKEEPKRILEELLIEHGLQDSIKTWNGYIIDGHNRYEICKKYGIPIRTTSMDLEFDHENDAKIWMIDNQFGRRDLEDYQRCELEFEKEHLKKSRQGKRTDLDNIKNSLTTSSSRDPEVKEETKKPHEESAEDAGVSPATYKRAKYIHNHADESIKQKLRDGDLKIKRAYLDLKAEEKASEAEGIGFPTDKHYKLFYCDPYYQTFDKEGSGWGFKDGYKGVDIEDLPVKDVKFYEAKCFIWTPPYFLTSSLSLMKSWGFEYQTSLCWELKEPYESQTVIGEYLLVLIGTVGGSNRAVFKPNTLLKDNGQGSRHDQVRAYIDKMHPEGDRLEILGKHKKEGWDLFAQREEAL